MEDMTNLIEVVRALHNNGIPAKRLQMQKFIYFLKHTDLSEELPFNFSINKYGPYSPQLQNELNNLVIDSEILEADKEYSTTRAEPINTDIYKKLCLKIKELKNIFGDTTFENLELLSTIHFAANSLQSFELPITEDSIVEEVRSIKGEKFSNDEISTGFKKLRENSLI